MADLGNTISLNASSFAAGIAQACAKLSELNTSLVENRNKMKELNQEAKELQRRERELADEMQDGGTLDEIAEGIGATVDFVVNALKPTIEVIVNCRAAIIPLVTAIGTYRVAVAGLRGINTIVTSVQNIFLDAKLISSFGRTKVQGES